MGLSYASGVVDITLPKASRSVDAALEMAFTTAENIGEMLALVLTFLVP